MIKERDLNETAKVFLEDLGSVKFYGEICFIDLVGVTNKNIIIALELKKRLNQKVLEQAYKRLKYVNYVYVGIPRKNLPTYYKGINIVYRHFLEYYGIGVVALDLPQKDYRTEGDFYNYTILKHAKINRITPAKKYLIKDFNELYENRDGGIKSGDDFSPYDMVVQDIKNQLLAYSRKDFVSIDLLVKKSRLANKHYRNVKAGIYSILNSHSWAEKKNGKYKYK